MWPGERNVRYVVDQGPSRFVAVGRYNRGMALRIKPVAILPTLCTLGNTFCGFLAISKVADSLLHEELFQESMLQAAWLIMLAMVFDALDGRIARLTNQASDFGAQMDSLTDLITFGVAPAFLAKVLFEKSMASAGVFYQPKFVLFISFIYVACATLRLARFTIETDLDEDSHEKFYGLPSPAAAGVVASSVFLLLDARSPVAELEPSTQTMLIRILPWFLPTLGLLMVSRVEYVHLASRWFRGRKPFVHVVLLVLLIAFVGTHHETAFFALFSSYAIAGPLMVFVEKTAGRKIFAPGAFDANERTLALISIGSNLGDREAHVQFAMTEIAKLPDTEVVGAASVVENDPIGGPPQRQFLNTAMLVSTTLEPRELLRALSGLERQRGRERTVKDGPRTLDLDLILFGATICESPDLTLPHPRFRDRKFVLGPSAAIAPDLEDPVTGKTISELLAQLPSDKTP